MTLPSLPAARRYSCAATSQALDEPVLGTASPTRGYLLVEEPGPWGPGAVPASRIGEGPTAALRATAVAASFKLLLVRRPEERHRAPAARTLFKVTCARGQEQVLTRTCAPDDVAAAAADDHGWAVHDAPLLLVCTHGRKDWCCAVRGRPLAQALASRDRAATWECSHLGGCRFAANVLSLPTGYTYGRVELADVAELTAAVGAGAVVPRLLRGRVSDAMVVQAAEVHARTALGRTGASALTPVGGRRLDEAGEHWRISFADTGGAADTAGAVIDVEVRLGHQPTAQRLTCGALEAEYARTWRLADLRVAASR